MELAFGIDISKWQGTNDYVKIKATTAYVFVKATESWGYTDPMFRANWQGLAGHNRGAYSYIWLSDDPLRQANHLIDIVTQAGVDWRYDRLVLDLERTGHGKTKAQVTEMVLIMMERIKEVTGRYPILYSRATWVNSNMLVTDPRIANADWWLAYYRKALPYPLFTPEMPPPPLMPTGVNRWLIHQTCEKGNGRAVGVGSHYVDIDRWDGTIEDVDAYFGRGETHEVYLPIIITPEPEPAIPADLLDVPVYAQKDPRWAQDRMGSSYFKLEQKGCLITITAAGLTYLGCKVDPKEYNLLASTKGGYEIKKEGNVIYANMYWKFPDILTNNKIVRAEFNWIYFNQGWKPKADAILASKRPVWTEVRLNGYQHWVLIIGKANGAYWCLDPWYGDIVDMSTRYDRVYRIVSYQRR